MIVRSDLLTASTSIETLHWITVLRAAERLLEHEQCPPSPSTTSWSTVLPPPWPTPTPSINSPGLCPTVSISPPAIGAARPSARVQSTSVRPRLVAALSSTTRGRCPTSRRKSWFPIMETLLLKTYHYQFVSGWGRCMRGYGRRRIGTATGRSWGSTSSDWQFWPVARRRGMGVVSCTARKVSGRCHWTRKIWSRPCPPRGGGGAPPQGERVGSQ